MVRTIYTLPVGCNSPKMAIPSPGSVLHTTGATDKNGELSWDGGRGALRRDTTLFSGIWVGRSRHRQARCPAPGPGSRLLNPTAQRLLAAPWHRGLETRAPATDPAMAPGGGHRRTKTVRRARDAAFATFRNGSGAAHPKGRVYLLFSGSAGANRVSISPQRPGRLHNYVGKRAPADLLVLSLELYLSVLSPPFARG